VTRRCLLVVVGDDHFADVLGTLHVAEGIDHSLRWERAPRQRFQVTTCEGRDQHVLESTGVEAIGDLRARTGGQDLIERNRVVGDIRILAGNFLRVPELGLADLEEATAGAENRQALLQ
jgi:hypothetical protein